MAFIVIFNEIEFEEARLVFPCLLQQYWGLQHDELTEWFEYLVVFVMDLWIPAFLSVLQLGTTLGLVTLSLCKGGISCVQIWSGMGFEYPLQNPILIFI